MADVSASAFQSGCQRELLVVVFTWLYPIRGLSIVPQGNKPMAIVTGIFIARSYTRVSANNDDEANCGIVD